MDVILIVAPLLGLMIAAMAARYAAGPHIAQRREEGRQAFAEARRQIARERPTLTEKMYQKHNSNHHDPRLPGLLTAPNLVPEFPIPIGNVEVDVNSRPFASSIVSSRKYRKMLPRKKSGGRIRRYSDAITDICPPGLWFDADCYALREVNMTKSSGKISFSRLSYFEGVDVAEALAHEAVRQNAWRMPSRNPIRNSVGCPLDFESRPTLVAVSALTLCVGSTSASFYLHERDSSKVAMAGGQVHLAPSGVHQPSATDPSTILRDVRPVFTLCREYAEEFLGVEEARGVRGASLSYEFDRPYSEILNLLMAPSTEDSGCWMLGVGIDPLTFAAEMICVTLIPETMFNEVFSELKLEDEEGFLRGAAINSGKLIGYEFNASTIEYLVETGRLSPAANAALQCTWHHRSFLGLQVD